MSDSETIKRNKSIQISSFLAIASWPAGIILGNIIASGQDPAGEGMAYGIGLIISVLFISEPACIYLAWRSKGYWRLLDFTHKSLIIIPFAPFTP